jgi:predicted lysophospholipase L1 biosynthesis ABC-type transport system permease subunit
MRRAWYLMRQRRLDADLADELECHRSMKQQELEERGLGSQEAHLAARRALGNVAMHTTGERRQEIGIRLTLGATRRHVVRLLVRETVLLAVAGTVVGVSLSWILARFMENLLFGVQARDPALFLFAGAGGMVVAALCALAAAGRFVRMDPVEALRRG